MPTAMGSVMSAAATPAAAGTVLMFLMYYLTKVGKAFNEDSIGKVNHDAEEQRKMTEDVLRIAESVRNSTQQAMDLKFDGLMVESHCNPDEALSDAKQQITPQVLDFTIKMLVLRENKQTTENISVLRKQIDEIDEQLLTILAKRNRVSREIGIYKKENNMPVLQTGRYNEILEKRAQMGEAMNLDKEFVFAIMKAIHEESVKIQLHL